MPTTYHLAGRGDEAHDALAHALESYHPELHQVELTADVLFAVNAEGPPLKRDGYPVLIKAKKTSLKDRAAGRADVELLIDAERWGELSHEEKLAAIDEALERFKVARDDQGHPKSDDLGRPRLTVRPFDVELGFVLAACRRHKDHVQALQALAKLRATFAELDIPWPTPEGLFA